MRIISQSGMIDLPYEQVGVFMNLRSDKEIIASPIEEMESDYYWILAEYSAPEKAKKAMKMLRERYMNLCVIKILASGAAEHMEKSFNERELESTLRDYAPKNVFQFPQDEEIEV